MFHLLFLICYIFLIMIFFCWQQNGKSWAIQLLSVACLSLAVKMEERKVPSLSQFRAKDYTFEWQVIQRMELLVLNTLEWRMSSVTPFAYLHYFSTKFNNKSRPNTVLSRAAELILETTKGKLQGFNGNFSISISSFDETFCEIVVYAELNFMKHRPSAIAAAAVLASSSDQTLTKSSIDFQMRVISSCGCLESVSPFPIRCLVFGS